MPKRVINQRWLAGIRRRKYHKKVVCDICGEEFPREEINYVSLVDFPTYGDALLCESCLDVLADGLVGARGWYSRACSLGLEVPEIPFEMTPQDTWDILLYGDRFWAREGTPGFPKAACFYYTVFPDWLELVDEGCEEFEICPQCGVLWFQRWDRKDPESIEDGCRNCGHIMEYNDA